MWESVADYVQIIIADLILSGDNALIIGMAAAGLPARQRKQAIFYGMLIAALLRIVFAVIATKLLGVPGLLFFGGLLLFWVCWRLYKDIKSNAHALAMQAEAEHFVESEGEGAHRTTLKAALISILIADVSMSLDNVLAVAAIADGDVVKLVFGLGLAIALMACAATFIAAILARYPIISWVGLIILLYVSADLLYRGSVDVNYGVGPMLGLIEGWETSKGHSGH